MALSGYGLTRALVRGLIGRTAGRIEGQQREQDRLEKEKLREFEQSLQTAANRRAEAEAARRAEEAGRATATFTQGQEDRSRRMQLEADRREAIRRSAADLRVQLPQYKNLPDEELVDVATRRFGYVVRPYASSAGGAGSRSGIITAQIATEQRERDAVDRQIAAMERDTRAPMAKIREKTIARDAQGNYAPKDQYEAGLVDWLTKRATLEQERYGRQRRIDELTAARSRGSTGVNVEDFSYEGPATEQQTLWDEAAAQLQSEGKDPVAVLGPRP